MTSPSVYQSTQQIIDDRTCWAAALLGEGINEGRARGWVTGAPIELATSSEDGAVAIARREAATRPTATAIPLT